MRLRTICLLLFIFFTTAIKSETFAQGFDRQHFYDVMSSGKMKGVNEELDLLSTSAVNEKEAYEGALLIRKAGLTTFPSEKLKLFKKGRIKLETAIMNDNKNAEYRFLRMSIEEHAPKIVKYNADIETDKAIVIKSFKSLHPAVQQAIIDYSKNSKVIHPQDF